MRSGSKYHLSIIGVLFLLSKPLCIVDAPTTASVGPNDDVNDDVFATTKALKKKKKKKKKDDDDDDANDAFVTLSSLVVVYVAYY